MSDFDLLMLAYEASGGDASLLVQEDVARLVVSGNEVIGANEIPGISMTAEPLADPESYGPLIADLVTQARPNADMSGRDRA